MTHFNEHSLEMAIMELFQNEGYIYTNGEEIHKEMDDVLLRDDLRMYLRSRYSAQGITQLETESVIAKLTADNGFTLYDRNVATYRLMTEGFSLKREDAGQPDLFIVLHRYTSYLHFVKHLQQFLSGVDFRDSQNFDESVDGLKQAHSRHKR